MSDEDSLSEGFSASEDEWKPGAEGRGGESSDDDDSDFEDATPASANNVPKKRDPKSKGKAKHSSEGVNSGGVTKKRKPAGQSLRTKLYNKYRPPPKTFPTNPSGNSNSPSASSSRTVSKNALRPNEDGENDEGSSSDDSIYDHLVDPSNIDLKSSFFDTNAKEAQQTTQQEPPQGHNDSGIIHTDENATETQNCPDNATFDFHSLLEQAENIERVKKEIARRSKENTGKKEENLNALDVNSLLALGEKNSGKKSRKKSYDDGGEEDDEDEEDDDDDDSNIKKVEKEPLKLSKTKSTRIKRHTKTRPTSTVLTSSKTITTGGSGKSSGAGTGTGAVDTDDSDWEEVADSDKDDATDELSYSISDDNGKQGDLEIIVEPPTRLQKCSKELKTQLELELAFKRRINHDMKKRQALLHKASLLCTFARNHNFNRILNDLSLMQTALKLLPGTSAYPTERGAELKYFESMVTWFKSTIKLKSQNLYLDRLIAPSNARIKDELRTQMQKKEARCKQEMVFIFVILLRGMGIQCRLIANMQPLPLKPKQSDLLSLKLNPPDKKSKDGEPNSETKNNVSPKNGEKPKGTSKAANKSSTMSADCKQKQGKTKSHPTQLENSSNALNLGDKFKKFECKLKSHGSAESKILKSSNDEIDQSAKGDGDGACCESGRNKKTANLRKLLKRDFEHTQQQQPQRQALQSINNIRGMNSNDTKTENKSKIKQLSITRSTSAIPQLDGADDAKNALISPNESISSKRRRLHKIGSSQDDADLIEIIDLDGDDSQGTDQQANRKRPHLRKLRAAKDAVDSDEDFVPSSKKVKQPIAKQPAKQRKSRMAISPDVGDETDPKEAPKPEGTAADVWAEVYSDVEQEWLCVDLFKGKVNSVESIRKSASSELVYVYAFQNDLTIKDVTARYCPHWATVMRKSRVDRQFLETAICQLYGMRTERDLREDQALRLIHEQKPLPKTICDFKDHPLYALERHLLKFQAIYPPDPPTLGFVRGEPIYSRDCVHTLHSREIWLKQARVVKLGEKPYKIVKARPKWDKFTQTVIKDQPLEIFGYWQTQDYEPPTAENGIVPRNAYGNVELFKECMLPKKTVHLRLSGLNRICKKLGIDCAPAVIGFDFHQGLCHPEFDGFVVCEEFGDQVTAAWYQDQEDQERKEQEKYEARVYGNWKKLIRGLLIKQRLKAKYNL